MRKFLIVTVPLLLALSACSSGPQVKQQKYAKLKEDRVFEYEFPVVWKGIEEAFRNYRVVDRDPSDVSPLEMKKLRKRTLETGWITTQSHDKYVEFKVNGFPRKQYLWTRVKYKITAQTVLGGTQVFVKPTEEVERLNSDGSSAGFEEVDRIDTSRPNEILNRINEAILSAAPN